MNTLSFKTHFATPEEAKKEWVVVDATDQIVGRLCAKVAKILRGKYKPCFTPNQDCGDNVIVINADKIQFSGTKWATKELITFSVKGMLPKGRLGAKVLRNLYVFEGPEHDKAAQSPKSIDINTLK